MLHILFSILISIGSASGYVTKSIDSAEKTYTEPIEIKVLADIDNEHGGW